MEPRPQPLIVIVGQTASGKSALAMELAQKVSGEIIAADARTVYRGMDIGTAKPSAADRDKVPHYMIDVVGPDEPFTAADFKRDAMKTIDDISGRNKIPIMAGGTGLYIDSVLYDFSFREKPDPELRKWLEKLSVEKLQQTIAKKNIPMPVNKNNPRHLVRAIETGGSLPEKRNLRPNTIIIGLTTPSDVLKDRIGNRVKIMVESGLEEEVRELVAVYGWQAHGLQTIGYKEWKPYMDNLISREAVMDDITRNTYRYAKRQRTWFRRNNSIQWSDNPEALVELVTTKLHKSS